MAYFDPRLRPLTEQDFDLAGIGIVVTTHLHADRCGGNHLFAGAPDDDRKDDHAEAVDQTDRLTPDTRPTESTRRPEDSARHLPSRITQSLDNLRIELDRAARKVKGAPRVLS